MPDISALDVAAQSAYLKLRHKYLNGSGEIVESIAGVLNDGSGTFPDTNFDCVISARSTLLNAASTTSTELVLPSASDAAKFQVGNNIQIFNWSTGGSVSTDTVLAVKGQKLILSTTPDAALRAGDIVVRFETAKVGGEFSSVTDASAGLPYVGGADAVEYLQAIQQNVTDIVYSSSPGTPIVGNSTGVSSDAGHHSSFATQVDIKESRNMEGDLITFATSPAGLVGCTARIISHTAADNDTLTVGDIRDSNGVFLGNQFPVATSASHSAGAATGLAVVDATTFTVQCGVVDKYIEKLTGSTAVPPGKNAGQENSNTPESASLVMMAMFELMSKFEPNDAVGEFVTANLEEKILGHMIGGATGTVQGKRLRLAADAANDVTSITVEMDNAINDIPFPLSGIVRLQNNRGTDNNQGAAGVGVSANLTYTRTKRDNVLTLGAVTGVTLKIGDVVELLPSFGPIMKGHAAQISGYDLVELMEVVHRQILEYDRAIIQ